jgi:hypothetical protein
LESEEGETPGIGAWLSPFSRSSSGGEEEEEQHQHQLNRICVRRLNGFTGTNPSSAGAWCAVRSRCSPADHCWKIRKGEAARNREREWEGEGDLEFKFMLMFGESARLECLVLPLCGFRWSDVNADDVRRAGLDVMGSLPLP